MQCVGCVLVFGREVQISFQNNSLQRGYVSVHALTIRKWNLCAITVFNRICRMRIQPWSFTNDENSLLFRYRKMRPRKNQQKLRIAKFVCAQKLHPCILDVTPVQLVSVSRVCHGRNSVVPQLFLPHGVRSKVALRNFGLYRAIWPQSENDLRVSFILMRE